MLQRVLVGVCSLAMTAVPVVVFAFQTKAAQDGFVPIEQLPPGEQLPAAPFLVGAYAFFLVLVVGYVWSIARRLGKVEQEMKVLEQRVVPGSRPR